MKKIFLAVMAVAAIVMAGCKNDKKSEPEQKDYSEVIARFNDG